MSAAPETDWNPRSKKSSSLRPRRLSAGTPSPATPGAAVATFATARDIAGALLIVRAIHERARTRIAEASR